MADEDNGRARWRQTPYFGGGSESAARQFRQRLAEALGTSAVAAPEALDAALWLLTDEKLAANQSHGMAVLRRIKGDAVVPVFRKLLAPAHPNAAVVVGLLDEVAARRLAALAPEVTALCGNYRTAVRQAATKAAAAMGLAAPPAFKPEAAFTPWLDGELRAIAAMVITPIPEGAVWRRFSVTEKPWQDGDPPRVREFSGWLLGGDEKAYQVLDLFAREHRLPKADTTVAERTFRQDADAFLAIRNPPPKKDGEPDDPFDRPADALSERGGLTGQFQPRFVSLPEALLAAWAYARGEKATAAAVIFPRIDAAADERWVRWAARDLIGSGYHDALLHAFSFDRDYATAARYAAHLGGPLFDDYAYQERAKELAAQLARRAREDFVTLTLPTPAKWAEMQKALTRPQQVEFLAQRLRLLNCFQHGQPGGVDLEDPQTDRPSRGRATDGGGAGKAVEVINPLVALRKMGLEVRDLPPLIPLLADEDFLPTFSYWRDFHPNRNLYRVNQLVARVINGTAKRVVAEVARYESLDAEGRKRHLEAVAKWVAGNGDKSRADLLVEVLSSATEFRDFARAATELAQMKERRAVRVLLDRADAFPKERADVAELCYHLSPPDFVDRARAWARGDDVGARFWAGMILLAAGPKGKSPPDGLAELRDVLDRDAGTSYFPRAFDALLATKDEGAIKLAETVLAKPRAKLDDWTIAPMVQRLLLAGRPAALAFVTGALDSAEPGGTSSGTYQGKRVQRAHVAGDAAARTVARWRADAASYDYPALAPDGERAAERARLRSWVTAQFELIRAGKPSGLRATPDPIHAARWQIDAP